MVAQAGYEHNPKSLETQSVLLVALMVLIGNLGGSETVVFVTLNLRTNNQTVSRSKKL